MVTCFECKTINECHNGYECIRCGECLGDQREHCHNKELQCIDFINDCEDHYRGCESECHSECACQDRA